jgi:hypothetical protein
MQTPDTIEQQADEAMARITTYINRAASQHQRSIEAEHARAMNALLGSDSPFCVRGPHGARVYVTSRTAVALMQRAPA